jgi:hypothetical protein
MGKGYAAAGRKSLTAKLQKHTQKVSHYNTTVA